MLDHIVVFFGFLFCEADAVDSINERLGAAVENRNFRTVDFDEAVVHAESVESGHSMFDSADGNFALAQYGAAVCGNHIFGYAVDSGLTFEVDALNFISVIFGSRTKFGIELASRMQTFAAEGEGALKGCLIHIWLFFYFSDLMSFSI